MALESPALLSAIMALSAIHRTSLTAEMLDKYDDKMLVASLKATSLRHLCRDLDRRVNGDKASLSATIRTLCSGEVLP